MISDGLDLVLASTSRYRGALLARLGIPFRCVAPRVDEEPWKAKGLSPRNLAEQLAEAKAVSLVEHAPNATLLGGDQVAACEGRLLGKPGTAETAVEQLAFLAGREHQLITAICVWHRGQTIRHTDITTLRMRELSRAELERYVAVDQPLDCAGSYKLEQAGITLFESIQAADHSAITGLPLIALATILRGLGFVTNSA